MPVAAFDDDHIFGAKEGPPWNLLFHFPNVGRDELTDAFCREDLVEEPSLIGRGRLISMYARRKRVFNEGQMIAAEHRPGGKLTDQAKDAIAIRDRMLVGFPRDSQKRPPDVRFDPDLT
jgi:hypothetical protein